MTLEQQPAGDKECDREWRRWLRTLVISIATTCAACYLAVVLIDPFSTGRFALTQRIDRVPNDAWFWFAKAGIVRDRQFDAIILGSSVAGVLDPIRIGMATGHKMLQFALYGAFPQNSLAALRAFERHRPQQPLLHVVILESHWCADRVGSPPDRFSWLPDFPTWVYESSDFEYLMRVFSPFAFQTALQRLTVWAGLREQSIPANGFAPVMPTIRDPAARAAMLLATKPETDAPSPRAPFPQLDMLAANLAALDAGAQVLLAFVPVLSVALPPPGSAAAARDAACKAKAADIAGRRPGTGYLDLQGDNSMAHKVEDFVDTLHFKGELSRIVEDAIAKAIRNLQSPRK